MLNFIQEQSQQSIFLIVIFITALCAAVVLCFARLVKARFAGVTFTTMSVAVVPVGTILGLTLGFLTQREWENFDVASRAIYQETTKLNQIASASSLLPETSRNKILTGVKEHIRHVLEDEWKLMSAEHTSTFHRAPGLAAIKSAILFEPSTQSERLGQQFILGALSEVATARMNRFRSSQTQIAPIVWASIILLSILVMIGIAVTLSDTFTVAIFSVALFAAAVSLPLSIIVSFDRPFSGGVPIAKEPMQDLLKYLSQ
jgi:hypothetical protein